MEEALRYIGLGALIVGLFNAIVAGFIYGYTTAMSNEWVLSEICSLGSGAFFLIISMAMPRKNEKEKGEKTMTTELTLVQEKKALAKASMQELRQIIATRKNPVIINGKRYLEFRDWQLIGMAFGVTAKVESAEEIWQEKPSKDSEATYTLKELAGFAARAVAIVDGVEVSAAEAECLFDEKNRDWKNKPRFMLKSMAQTRACAKALRNCLSWVLDYADYKDAEPAFADDAAVEETQLL